MSIWGPLAERYEDVNGEGRPRKLLALDGGGIRGVITLEVLVRMERLLSEATGRGDDFRLCEFFDYIAGTSTGAIIAAGLARGMSARELREFYLATGPAMFEPNGLMQRLKSRYDSDALSEQLRKTFGSKTTLEPEHLKSLLLIVTHNLTTDSAWPISSNPLAKYNDLTRPDCNLRIPLWQLVRASTAAPVFFPPEVVNWDPNDPEKSFVFADGGITPYNNPAFLLFRMATQPAYRLSWKTGDENLLLVSIGTGAAPNSDSARGAKWLWSNASQLPSVLMYGAAVEQDVNCRTFGRCVHGASIDREMESLVLPDGNEKLSGEPERLFRYARYNADLSAAGLRKMGLSDVDPDRVQKMDGVDAIEELSQIGQKLADEVVLSHFGHFVSR